ncbi:hypothetical protein P43SY_007478 [Pythium insidiosum]|uniref:BZIP domain-containing protein n=1 Tax=Pythium insidiosum TaxID=114742 RepID=A0AAD5Q9F1_PYTIN|nr:hypothetical protein P43SY_007478 [Pythium insidiosum]
MSPTSTTAAPTQATPSDAKSLPPSELGGAPPTPADMTADMDLLNATNREMFSWLLFNSENITAPLVGHGASVPATSAPMSHHHQPLDSIDDPFRLIPHDDPLDPLAHHHHAIAASAVTAAVTATPAIASAAMTMAPAATTSVASSLHVNVPAPMSGAVPEKGAAKRRGKKRPADDSPATPTDLPTTPLSAASSSGATTPTMPSSQGLLRHLQHASDALAQKRAATAMTTAAANQAIKAEKSGSSGSESPDRLRKLKLERNRESARECRRRKREHILNVEERCRQLERENMELRGQLKAGKEAMKQEEREKNRVCEELEQMIKRGASERELAEKIDNFKEQYSDYGHGRRSALDYHLHQIERLLLPTQVTKMCIWALRQDDSFWHDEEDETSLPVILARELGLTDEQKKKIQQQRAPFMSICDNLKTALGLLNELKTQVTDKNTTLDLEMDKLQNILTPTQRAKFIVWVTNNQACMHLLNKLWRSVL